MESCITSKDTSIMCLTLIWTILLRVYQIRLKYYIIKTCQKISSTLSWIICVHSTSCTIRRIVVWFFYFQRINHTSITTILTLFFTYISVIYHFPSTSISSSCLSTSNQTSTPWSLYSYILSFTSLITNINFTKTYSSVWCYSSINWFTIKS